MKPSETGRFMLIPFFFFFFWSSSVFFHVCWWLLDESFHFAKPQIHAFDTLWWVKAKPKGGENLNAKPWCLETAQEFPRARSHEPHHYKRAGRKWDNRKLQQFWASSLCLSGSMEGLRAKKYGRICWQSPDADKELSGICVFSGCDWAVWCMLGKEQIH